MATGDPGITLSALWTPADALGSAEVDRGHARTARLHRDALEAEGSRFPAALRALRRHLAGQFAREERLMAAAGFPPRRLHAAEHAAVLAALDRIAADGSARGFLATRFAAWFRHHLATMDRATARFLRGERFLGCALMCGPEAHCAAGPSCDGAPEDRCPVPVSGATGRGGAAPLQAGYPG